MFATVFVDAVLLKVLFYCSWISWLFFYYFNLLDKSNKMMIENMKIVFIAKLSIQCMYLYICECVCVYIIYTTIQYVKKMIYFLNFIIKWLSIIIFEVPFSATIHLVAYIAAVFEYSVSNRFQSVFL